MSEAVGREVGGVGAMSDAATQRLAEIRVREQRATQAPWRPVPSIYDDGYWVYSGTEGSPTSRLLFETREESEEFEIRRHGPRDWWGDILFAAHARSDVPWLLAEVERLEARVEELARDALLQLILEVCSDVWAEGLTSVSTRALWDDIHGPAEGLERYRQHHPEIEQSAKDLRRLSAEAGGWWDALSGKGRAFVPLDEWLREVSA